MKIPFNDLKAHHAALATELEGAALRVLRSGWYILGPEVAAFEAEAAAWLGLAAANQVVGVNSGTDALHLALLAGGCGPGAEVITVAHTAVATVAAIVACGARPVLVDIEADTFTLDPARLAAALTPRTKAIIPVHLYGQPADLEPILTFAQQHGLLVIEDCAQAHGAHYAGRPVGAWGDLGCFSFYPTKNLGAAGDGGLVVSRHPALTDRVRSLREYGWQAGARYISQEHGLNSRLDELQAALLRVKLPHVQAWNDRRQALAARYDRLLAGSGIVTPRRVSNRSHVYHLYVIRHPRRDDLRAALQGAGIGALIHYPKPIHLQPAYTQLAQPGALPVTEQIAQEILSLPLYPEMTDAAVDEVAGVLQRAAAAF
jgi:dTDP-4-amino-4,6-dideoxygalactose transaminase